MRNHLNPSLFRTRFRNDPVQAISIPWIWIGLLQFSLKNQEQDPQACCSSDIEDIHNSQNGDAEAFRRLVERYQGHVSKLLWRFTRDKNSHEELVQESFVQVYLSLRSYRTHAPFEHWLSRIATRVGYRFWKQTNRHSHTSLQEADSAQITATQSDSLEPQQAAEIVHKLLEQLTPRDRLVLTLRYLEQCSVEETAHRTGMSKSLVKVQTHRAKQKLMKILRKSDIEFEL